MIVHDDQWVNAARFDVLCKLWARAIVTKHPALEFHTVYACLRDEMCDDMIWKILDNTAIPLKNRWERYWATKHTMTRQMLDCYGIIE